ncbi:hypothetical protein MAR_011329, partial [Mya arenaria]
HQEGETVKPLPRQLGNEFKCVTVSKKGDDYARFTACNTDVSIGSCGRNDLTRHLTSKTHLAKAEAISSTRSIQNFGTVDAIQDEFVDYQLMAHCSLPAYKNGMPVDPYWAAMSKKVRFPTLVPLAFAALSLQHSNADPERCFSSLKKIQRDDRGSLNKQAINALLSLKYNSKTPCFKTEITSDMCAEARK